MEPVKKIASRRRQELVSKERLYVLDIPIVFREPFIYSGYRPLGRKWLYYLGSLFQVHTETANVWSHLLGVFYFIYKTYQISDQVDLLSDPLAWAFLAFTFASVGYTFLSAAAHLLHTKSPEAHFLCYQIDYIGICLNCQSIGLCTYFLIGDDLFYRTFGWGFLVVNALCAIAVCAGCSISKLGYRRPYPFVSKLWRLIPATLCSIVCGCMPLFYKTYGWLNGEGGGDLLISCYTIMGWTAIGAFFFVTYIPERFAPGRFDLIGHSHFIFHVILVYVTHLQYETFLACYLRTTAKHRQVMVNPSPVSTVGMQILAILGCLLVLYLTRGMRKARANGRDACCVEYEQNGTEIEGGLKPKTQ